jgi:predicted Zn-dependent protease
MTRMRSIVPWLSSGSGRPAQVALLAALLLAAAGCTPQSAFIMGLLPDGTVSALLSHIDAGDEQARKVIYDLEARKDWDGISRIADDNVQRDRNSSSWWFVAGYAHAEAGRPGKAAEAFSELVRLAPDDPLGWNMLAQAYRDNKQPQRAVQALSTAHQLRKGTASTYFLLGECYADLDRDLPAAGAYRESLHIDANYAPAWFGLGRTAARLGRTEDFDSALKSLERLDPKKAKELAELRPVVRQK